MDGEWEKFGRNIRDIVEDAVASRNFSQLSKAVTDTVNEARDAFFFQPDEYNRDARARKLPEENKKRQDPALFQKNTGVKVGGWTMAILGYTFSFGLGLVVLILILSCLFLGSVASGIRIAFSVLLPFLVAGAAAAWKGGSLISALKRYRGYIEGLNGKTYCNIEDLAGKSGRSFRYVKKDLKKMIKKGWFRQGHLDDDNACLIVSHDTYREYRDLQRQRLEQKNLELEEREAGKDKGKEPAGDSRVQKVMEEGNAYLEQIRACNRAIPGEEISGKISRMETLVQKIFDRVGEDPDSLDDISKLMEYYLPTTVKLLEAYRQLDSQPIQGENIMSSKREIEKTLGTLNAAFEKLLDSLFEDVAWDVSSDISVLNTMLSQEGLAGKDFDRTKNLG